MLNFFPYLQKNHQHCLWKWSRHSTILKVHCTQCPLTLSTISVRNIFNNCPSIFLKTEALILNSEAKDFKLYSPEGNTIITLNDRIR